MFRTPNVKLTYNDGRGNAILTKSLNIPDSENIGINSSLKDRLHVLCEQFCSEVIKLSSRRDSQISFDLKQTKSSTPLLPDRKRSTPGSDDLFTSNTTTSSKPDSFGAQSSSTPLSPERKRPKKSTPGSGDLFTSDTSSSHKPDSFDTSCTDDIDTQPPVMFLDPQLLEQVSEDDTSGELSMSMEPTTVSTQGTNSLNSLGVDFGKSGKDIGEILVCSPTYPEEPSPAMFKDLKFVLSCPVDKSWDCTVEFSKEVYEKKLSAGGGIVYNEIPTNTENTILVSDKHSESYKFWKALLLGIPCVKVAWVDDCIINHRPPEECGVSAIQRTLLLFRGRDLLTDVVVRQDRDLETPKPFHGQIIYLQGSSTFKDTWSGLVDCGGGRAIKRWFKGTSMVSCPTIVVSDQTSQPSKTTTGFNVPIVTVNWLKQCVITGSLAEPRDFYV